MSCSKTEGCKDYKLRLFYFNSRGGAEAIRWILNFAKVPFEDVRYTREEWDSTPALKEQSPTGQMPMLEITKDGKTQKMVQSFAIARALAGWNNLAGKTPCEHGACDEVVECLRDFIQGLVHAHFEKDETKKVEMMTKLKTETGPRIFGYMEKRITDNGGKYFVGDAYTYADIEVASFLSSFSLMNPNKDEFNAMAQKFPNLFALANAVAETPEIKAWIAKRPVTQF